MEFRKFGKHNVSILGVGLFQPQCLTQEVNLKEYVAALKFALDFGVSIIDLGFPQYYSGDRSLVSECGELLNAASDIVTVMNVNVYAVDNAATVESELLDTLSIYGLSRVTYIQMYGVDRVTWKKLNNLGILDCAKGLIQSGFADGLTCYFTDDRFYLKPILESRAFDAISLEYSFIDIARNPGSLKLSKDFGLGIAVRGVTKDGRLAENLPPDIETIWSRNPEHSPIEWALSVVWDRPEISTAIIDMLTVAQAKYYCSFAESFSSEDADITGLILAKQVSDIYFAKRMIRCMMCRACMPCPLGINTPRIAELYNEYLMYGNKVVPALQYKLEQHNARLCSKCLKCAKTCPRLFPLHEIISEADRVFTN